MSDIADVDGVVRVWCSEQRGWLRRSFGVLATHFQLYMPIAVDRLQ